MPQPMQSTLLVKHSPCSLLLSCRGKGSHNYCYSKDGHETQHSLCMDSPVIIIITWWNVCKLFSPDIRWWRWHFSRMQGLCGKFDQSFPTCSLFFKWRSAYTCQIHSFSPQWLSELSGLWTSISSFPWWVPTLCPSSIVSPLWLQGRSSALVIGRSRAWSTAWEAGECSSPE